MHEDSCSFVPPGAFTSVTELIWNIMHPSQPVEAQALASPTEFADAMARLRRAIRRAVADDMFGTKLPPSERELLMLIYRSGGIGVADAADDAVQFAGHNAREAAAGGGSVAALLQDVALQRMPRPTRSQAWRPPSLLYAPVT